MRRLSVVVLAALVLAGTAASVLFASAAAAAAEGTVYTANAPTVDGISEGPWNSSQGDPSAGSAYPSSVYCRSSALAAPKRRSAA